MSILVNKKSKIVVQGITGTEGKFHSEQMLDYGTNIVGLFTFMDCRPFLRSLWVLKLKIIKNQKEFV